MTSTEEYFAAKSDEALQARIEKLEAENAKLKSSVKATFKVTEKGGVSVYGLGRFPVTLYVQQWEKLFGMLPDLQDFLAENQDRLSRK